MHQVLNPKSEDNVTEKQQLYLHDCSFDLVSSVVHVERELCPDSAGVLNQTNSGAVS